MYNQEVLVQADNNQKPSDCLVIFKRWKIHWGEAQLALELQIREQMLKAFHWFINAYYEHLTPPSGSYKALQASGHPDSQAEYFKIMLLLQAHEQLLYSSCPK